MGIVLCPAHGHEFIQFHRAFRQLALQLSRSGYPVLRFDFSGCGDSEGDEGVWSLERWNEDLVVAIEEVKQHARTSRVALIGLRLGASIALTVASSREDVDTLVLWDPVVSGSGYLREQRAQHARMLGYAHVIPQADGAAHEVLGFALPEAFAAELESLDTATLRESPAARALIVESNAEVDQAPLSEQLAALGTKAERQEFQDPHLWSWVEDFGKVHVPKRLLDAVEAWVSGRGA